MKKTYIQPEAAIVSVNLIGTILEDPNPGGAGYSVETSEVNAKENDDVVVDDDDLSYSPMHTDWSTE
jgi:hypothetical protein